MKNTLQEIGFNALFEHSPISTQIFTPNGQTLMVNKAWENLWGIKAEKIIGNYNILLDKQLVDHKVMPLIKKGFSGEVVDIPAIKYEPEKTVPSFSTVLYKWVKALMYPIKDDKEKVLYIVLQHEDVTFQTKTEEREKEFEERFQALFNQSTIGLSIAGLDGKWTWFNKAYPKIFGYSEEELKNMHPLDLIPPKEHEKSAKLFQQLITGKTPALVTERTYIKKDGTFMYGIVHGTLIKDEKGKPKYVTAAVQDITDRKKTENELTRAKEQLEAILKNVADGITAQDPQGNLIFANTIAAKNSGYKSVNEMLQAPLLDYVNRFEMYDENGNPVEPNKLPGRRALQGEKNPHLLVKTFNKQTKEIRYMNIKSTAILDSQKKPYMIINTIQDLTEQKVAEQRIKESEYRFKKLFNSNIIGVFISDYAGKFLEGNDAFLQIIGYTRKELLAGKILRDEITPPDFLAKSQEAIQNMMESGFSKAYEKEYIHKSGRHVPVLIAVTDIGNKTCIGFVVDITDRKLLEKQKDEFLSIASHELKTPLTSLKGYTQVLKLFYKNDEKPNYYLSRMDEQVNRLTGLVNDLLDVSRIQQQKLALEKEKVNINSLIKEIVDDIQPTTKKHTVHIKEKNKLFLSIDKYRLSQVIINLLTNAIKYSPNAEKIIITIEKKGGIGSIKVKDFGIGIQEKNIEKIFEPFYQADTKVRQSFGGLGLGLYISREIVSRHGGSIQVKSKKGVGSTFTINLPI